MNYKIHSDNYNVLRLKTNMGQRSFFISRSEDMEQSENRNENSHLFTVFQETIVKLYLIITSFSFLFQFF